MERVFSYNIDIIIMIYFIMLSLKSNLEDNSMKIRTPRASKNVAIFIY